MLRRDFLKMAGAAPLALVSPGLFAAPVGDGAHWDRILVLVELKGGNDGLNMVVPYADAEYYALRPRLAVAREQVLQLSERVGFNPVLEPLMKGWEGKDLAVALGVGYENPNRSHFRSIEIWETGSDSDEYVAEGWISRLFAQHKPAVPMAAEGIVIGEGSGPLVGANVRTIAMEDPQSFVRQAAKLEAPHEVRSNKALAHLLAVQAETRAAATELERKVKAAPALKATFPRHALGRRLETTAKLLAGGVPLAVIKVSHGSFDTHSNQRANHDRLLGELAGGLAAFREAMVEAGLWNRVMVMTYSEFGRRARENGSAGTDHGTAAPHLVMGGRVKGGLYGEQPALAALENGDLKHSLDYRCMYATVAEEWWGVGGDFLGDRKYKPLGCIG